jgi:hypothetical protein
MTPSKRITVKRGRLKRIFVVPAEQCAELRIGSPVRLNGEPDGERLTEAEYTVTKIEDTEILAHLPLPRRVK